MKTAADERVWSRAKDIIRAEYPGKEERSPNSFYALVTTVYKEIKSSRRRNPRRRNPVPEISDAAL